MATNIAQGNDGDQKFDPKFPAVQLVKDIQSGLDEAQVKTLGRLANLSVPVVGHTAHSESIDAAIQKVLAHGETSVLFGQLFSGAHNGTLTREDLDQRLVSWAFKIPALKEKIEGLPEDARQCIHQFKDSDLQQDQPVPLSAGFKRPISSSTAKKIAVQKAAWQRQFDLDKGLAYPNVVENTGQKVMYVEKLVFENWGETIKNTPAVESRHCFDSHPGDLYPQEYRWRTEHCKICKRNWEKSSSCWIQVFF